jgi:hypothetical protein
VIFFQTGRRGYAGRSLRVEAEMVTTFFKESPSDPLLVRYLDVPLLLQENLSSVIGSRMFKAT